jgi:Copper amine oxidase N-terminal domain
MAASSSIRFVAAIAALGGIVGASFAEGIFVRRDTVVPVKFDTELTIKGSRTGQRFYATVDERGDLPFGARLEGSVVGVHEADGDRPAYLDLEFRSIETPDGSRAIRAVPMAFDAKHVDQKSDGRFVAKKSVRRRADYAIGGALIGYIVGSTAKKQLEGLVAGLIAGIILAETDRVGDGNVVIRRGQRMGALFMKDFRWDDYDRGGDGGWKVRDGSTGSNSDWKSQGDEPETPGWKTGDPQDPQFSGNYDLRAGRRTVDFRKTERPYYADDVLMVPLERVCDAFKIKFKNNYDDGYELKGDLATMRLQRDSKEFRVSGRFGQLPVAVVERYGVIFVPVSVIATVSKDKVTVNGNRIRPLAY